MHLVQLEGRLKDAVEKIESRPAKTIGRENQLTHAKSRLVAVRKILDTPEGTQVFPDGDDLSTSDATSRSVFDVSK